MHPLALTAAAQGTFDPLSLFRNGEKGVWYDPSDLATVWEDAAMTTPASVNGVVGAIQDKSGNGKHATQATAANKPILRQSGGLTWLEFDGVNDSLSTAAQNFTATDKMTVFEGVAQTVAQAGIFCELSANTNGNNGAFQTSIDVARAPGCGVRGNTSAAGVAGSAVVLSTPFVHTAIMDIAQPTRETELTQRKNGAPDAVTYAGPVDNDGGNLGNHVLYIGARAGTSLFLAGRIYQLIVRGAASSLDTIIKAEKYVGNKTGVTW